jgi:hypothetical protein
LETLKRPHLDAQWTEQILATPIRPTGSFPFNAVPPAQKLKSAEKMSRSMMGGLGARASNHKCIRRTYSEHEHIVNRAREHGPRPSCSPHVTFTS